MKRFAIIALAALSLASCSTTDAARIDTAVQQSLTKACPALETAHLAFVAIAASGSISQRTIAREAAAYAGVQAICVDPGRATAVDAAIRVAQAYVIVSAALKEARS